MKSEQDSQSKRDLKPEFNKHYNTVAAYVLAVAAILISYILLIIYWKDVRGVIRTVLGTLSPFFYGFAIAYILNPIYGLCVNGFEKLFRRRKNPGKTVKIFSLLATYLIALAFLAMFFSIIVPQLWLSAQKLMTSFPSYIDAVEKKLDIRFTALPFLSSETINEFLSDTENGLVNWLETIYSTFTAYTPKVVSAITGFAAQVWNFVLGFIISIYMLADKQRFSRQFKKLLYAVFKREHAESILDGTRKIHSTFGGFLSGKIIDSFIVGLLCFFGMNLLSIPYAPLVSVVVGVTNVIPYFGPFLGAIPSAFIILLDNPVKAVWFGIFILILQQIDGNIIGPKIIGSKIGLSSFWVIFALLIIGSFLGVLGLLLAVPIFALIYDFVTYLCNRSLQAKGFDRQPDFDGSGKEKDVSGPNAPPNSGTPA